jgi:hypothetical protein
MRSASLGDEQRRKRMNAGGSRSTFVSWANLANARPAAAVMHRPGDGRGGVRASDL